MLGVEFSCLVGLGLMGSIADTLSPDISPSPRCRVIASFIPIALLLNPDAGKFPLVPCERSLRKSVVMLDPRGLQGDAVKVLANGHPVDPEMLPKALRWVSRYIYTEARRDQPEVF